MKKLYQLIFLLLNILLLNAQKTISGIVTDDSGEALAAASVTVEEPGKDAIIAYSITNSKGEYKVTFTSSEPKVDIKIKAYNQKPLVKSVANETHTENFRVESGVTEIQEVKLKTRMITKRGDTISYDLKAFENKADRSLADVLKKIPGIEVNTDGTVLYQGEPINKFYVNGKDLMEGGYGSINNSLPKDAVQKIEVMENHQPVKILQNKVPSESAAINVKLKNSVTMTGRGELGTGAGAGWLWNAKLTPMFFGQKSQWTVNYKTNNTGETVEAEGNILSFGNRYEGRRKNVSQENWLRVENADVPNLPQKRYLMNSVHYLSANLLVNPFKSKEWELKANAGYTNNDVARESYSETSDLLNKTTYFENINNRFFTEKAKGELIFSKNAKKGFFKNTTTFSQFWNADRASVLRKTVNGNQSAREGTESPTVSFQNSLSTIVPWKEKLVNLMSYISIQNDRQILDISPASYLQFGAASFNTVNADFVRQNFKLTNIEINHSASVGFSVKNWTFTPEIGFNYSSDALDTDLTSSAANIFTNFGNAYANDLKFTNARPYAALGINYKSDSWLVYSNIPVNINHFSADDNQRNVSKNLDKVTLEPGLFAQYSFASFWKASANANFNYTFGSTDDSYAGFILRSPSSITAVNAKNPLPQIRTGSAGAKLEYRNPLNNLFFNLSGRISQTKRNIVANVSNNGSGFSITEYLEKENQSKSKSGSAEIGKYFPKLKTNASITYSHTVSDTDSYRSVLNGTGSVVPVFFENTSTSDAVGLKFNNTYFKWMSIDYVLKATSSRQENPYNNLTSRGFTHNLSTFFYPIENHTLGFNWDQINSGRSGTTYRNAFYDLSYQYTWSAKKIDFEVKWVNIANLKVFEIYSLGTTQNSYTKMQLRPSQVLLTVKFNFK